MRRGTPWGRTSSGCMSLRCGVKGRDGAGVTATRFSVREREKRVEGALPALLQPALSMTNAARMEGCSIATSATRSRERDACIAAIEDQRCVRPIACKNGRIGPCRLAATSSRAITPPCPVLPRKLSARRVVIAIMMMMMAGIRDSCCS